MEQADQGRRTDDLAGIDALADGVESNPLDSFRFVDVRGRTDVIGAVRDEQQILGVRRTDRGLQRHQRCYVPWPPAGFLLDFSGRCDGWILVGLDVASGQLPD